MQLVGIELKRVQIEDTLGDRVGVTGNSLEVVEDNSSDIKDALELLDNAVAGNEPSSRYSFR